VANSMLSGLEKGGEGDFVETRKSTGFLGDEVWKEGGVRNDKTSEGKEGEIWPNCTNPHENQHLPEQSGRQRRDKRGGKTPH